mmetsp:Transcript_36899/g.115495  ORF Transcript_36899/g.115495 Transcript_36899/m.115495 type:complete len:572 (+) Transcript_36899:70-1785(+)
MFMYPAGTEGAPGTLPQAAAAADALEGGSPLRPRQEGKLPACQMNTPTLVLAARPGRGRLDVALVDLRLVARDDLAPLELAHRREQLVLRRPELGDEDDLSRDLKLGKLALLALGGDVLEHGGDHFGVLADGTEIARHAERGRELHERALVWADECDAVRHRGERVHHRQRRVLRRLEHVLNLGEGDVLALLQLDKVLLAIDDHQVALGRVLADVACAKVALAVDRHELVAVLRHHVRVRRGRVDEVAVAHARPADEDLAAGHANLLLVLVRVHVAALLPVAQLDARGHLRWPDLRRGVVAREGDARGRARLGEAVALPHAALEDGLHKLLHLRAEGRRAGHHQLHVAAEQLLHLFEDEVADEVRPVSAHAARVILALAVGDRGVNAPLHEPRQRGELGLDADENLVEHRRCGDEDGGRDDGHVAELRRAGLQHLRRRRCQGAHRAVPDLGSHREAGQLNRELHDVRQRQVGAVGASRLEVGLSVERQRRAGRERGAHHGKQAFVRDEDALWVAGGARRVHEHRRLLGRRRGRRDGRPAPRGDQVVQLVDFDPSSLERRQRLGGRLAAVGD